MNSENLIIIGIFSFLLLLSLAVIIFYRRQYSQNFERRSSKPPGPDLVEEKPSPPSAASLHDPITGLYNRKHLLRRLQEMMARCDRNQERMALILWDIDGFIDFNNRYGKEAGDQFLKKVADTIRNAIRDYDEAFRSGSDEFCAVLIQANEKITAEVSGRVAQVVAESLFEGSSEYANQTFSISSGAVYYPGEHRFPEALLYAAGQELFTARLTRQSTPIR